VNYLLARSHEKKNISKVAFIACLLACLRSFAAVQISPSLFLGTERKLVI
jgi:hypothetical protein